MQIEPSTASIATASAVRGFAAAGRRGLIALAMSCATLYASGALAGEAARVFHVEGDVTIAKHAVKVGDAVAEGDEIRTGATGYVYMKTVDDGTFILRPGSVAKIAVYRVDLQNPANTQVKFELLSGIARSKSGNAVKAARQNFRFNTPVAAIGVRGTDFTVFTDAETSRVTVLSGGIVVSGFSGACRPEGGGPCEGAASRELAATQVGQMLQVRRGQSAPQLMNGGALAPDVVAPPRSDEASAKSGTAVPVVATVGDVNLDPQKALNLLQNIPPVTVPPVVVQPVIPPVVGAGPGQIIWGRWAALAGTPATIDIAKEGAAGSQVIAINGTYAVLRAAGADWQVPDHGQMGFALKQSEAYIQNDATHLQTAATVENGKLNVDFAKSTFATSLDLVSQAERFKLQATGDITKDGRMVGVSQFSLPTNMAVSGVLGPENGGTAAYTFQSRLDATRLAVGVTYWGK